MNDPFNSDEGPKFTIGDRVKIFTDKHQGCKGTILYRADPHPQSTNIPRFAVKPDGHKKRTILVNQGNLRAGDYPPSYL